MNKAELKGPGMAPRRESPELCGDHSMPCAREGKSPDLQTSR